MIQLELKAYRRCSDRHVLVLETNLTYVEKCGNPQLDRVD